jgi:hypothetical protein
MPMMLTAAVNKAQLFLVRRKLVRTIDIDPPRFFFLGSDGEILQLECDLDPPGRTIGKLWSSKEIDATTRPANGVDEEHRVAYLDVNIAFLGG